MRRLCTFFQKPINVTASSHSSERNEIDGEGEHGAQQTYLLFTALSTTFTEMQASAFEMNKVLQKDTRWLHELRETKKLNKSQLILW